MKTALLGTMAFFAVCCWSRAADAPVFFEKDVLPILRENCHTCHGGLRDKAGLDLRTHASLLKGGASGVTLDSKNPDASLLWKKIASDEMPKGDTKLSNREKSMIRAWIESGAPILPPEPVIAPGDKPRDPKVVAEIIDREIDRALAEAKVKPAPQAEDSEFFRRVHLDVIGRIPTPEAVRAFLADSSPHKREKLIDDVLARPEFGQHLAMIWHHVLVRLSEESKREYHEGLLAYLKDSFNEGRPWSKIVGEMLTAEGDLKKDPKTVFLAGRGEPGPAGYQTGRLFLGIDLECAECHNHPQTHWRQKNDFWGLAAFFAQTNFKSKLSEKAVPKPGIKIPTTALTAIGSLVPPTFPGSEEPVDPKLGTRAGLAAWLATKENPYFARNTANRMWAHFFGRGLVNPVTDLRHDNPASHPVVLANLTAEFHAADHDVKQLVRVICRTRAYQRSSRGEADQGSRPELYDRMALKQMTPEVLYDSLCVALGQNDIRGLPKRALRPGEKADSSMRFSPRNVFVNKFPVGDEAPPATSYDHGEIQVLTLINILDGNGDPDRLKTLLDDQRPAAGTIDEIYLATLSRLPKENERRLLTDYLATQNNSREAFVTVYWGLLNAAEFLFNH